MSASEQDNFGVIYARFSDKNQKELSIDGQLRECRALAVKMGIKIIGEYVDRAISGRTDVRPQFQKMIADSAKKKFGFVLSWKMDRIARNRYDSAMYKARLKANGVKFSYVADNIPDSPEGILIESMLEGMAEYYSVNLATNVKRGMKDVALKAKYTGGPVTLGYKIVDGHFVVDDLTAPIVREAFQMTVGGIARRKICRDLSEKYGITLLHHRLDNILVNKKYIGIFEFGSKWDDQVVIEDGIPAIVDAGMFRQVGAIMESAKGRPNLGKGKYPKLLSGKVVCGRCGHALFSKEQRYKETFYKYYVCNTANESKCDLPYISAKYIEDEVLRLIYAEVLTPESIDRIARKACELQEAESAGDDADDENELRAVQRSIGNIMTAIESGIITTTTKERLESLEKRQAELVAVIDARESKKSTALSSDQIRAFFRSFRNGNVDDPIFRKRLCDTFVHKVVIHDKKSADVYLNVSNSAGDGFIILPLSGPLWGQTDKMTYRRDFHYSGPYGLGKSKPRKDEKALA